MDNKLTVEILQMYINEKNCDKWRGHQKRALVFNTTIISAFWVLLICTSNVLAAPTITGEDIALYNYSNSLNKQNTFNVSKSNARLVCIGHEIIKPSVVSEISNSIRQGRIKSLPALPAAALMALTGFIYISLVRDRKIWMAAVAGLLCAGHAGILTVPQLARHFCPKTHNTRQIVNKLAGACIQQNDYRIRSDIEGTGYIGLLNHLSGIPLATDVLHQFHISAIFNNKQNRENKFWMPKFALTLGNCFHDLVSISSWPKTGYSIIFSPAFIFENLARAPPNIS